MRQFIALASVLLISTPSFAEQVSPTQCSRRLADISEGLMSGDDTLVLNDCALAGYITSVEIEAAYQKAIKARS